MDFIHLEQKVTELIETNKEDSYYDFKCCYTSNVDLVHDIICLANVKYDGERYLIIGISNDCKIIGLKSGEIKTQSQIIDLLAGSHFSNGNFPEISLSDIQLAEKTIQVIKIQNKPLKPYFLESDKIDASKAKLRTIRAGVIYSRNGCRNTAIDKTATLYDIEHMWKERFGLGLSPLDRLSIYLSDSKNWENLDYTTWFYKPFPEFTFKETSSEESDNSDKWFFLDLYPEKTNICKSQVSFFYHVTQIKTVHCIQQYDGVQYTMCLPQLDHIPINPTRSMEADNTFYFYYLIKDSFDWILLQFYYFNLRNAKPDKVARYLTDLRYTYPRKIKLPIFENTNEKDEFVKFMTQNLSELTTEKISEINLPNNLEKDTACGTWAFKLWRKWSD